MIFYLDLYRKSLLQKYQERDNYIYHSVSFYIIYHSIYNLYFYILIYILIDIKFSIHLCYLMYKLFV